MDVLEAWRILVQCDSVVNSGDLTCKIGRAHPVKKKILRTCEKKFRGSTYSTSPTSY